MIRACSVVLFLALGAGTLQPAVVAAAPSSPTAKDRAIAAVEARRAELIDLSRQLWQFAEIALRETRSAQVLADYAAAQGLTVERGVAQMPTAFVASYGQGRPIIAVLGEYDALPGLSQIAAPRQEALEPGAAGHGCGHNLFGPASLGAAVAIKELIAGGDLRGTVRFYGTPAEEAVGGKVYMVRAGLFDDVDVALAWHPGQETRADTRSSQAVADFAVEFHGRQSHAAFDPWNGRSALDGVEIFTHALNLMREHVEPTVRMHYVITHGGDVPNVVPGHARVWCWVRDTTHQSVDQLLERVRKITAGAALAAEVEATLTMQAGDYEMLVNMTGERLLHANLAALGPLPFSAEEQELARQLQRATGVEPEGLSSDLKPFDDDPGPPEGGSTDVADVSWKVPTLHFTVTTAPSGTPWHAWPVVASSSMSFGHQGMLHAAKALAATMVDLFVDADQRHAIRREFEDKLHGQVYKPYVPDGPPPVPSD